MLKELACRQDFVAPSAENIGAASAYEILDDVQHVARARAAFRYLA